MQLEGKTALVTGAGSGLGAEISRLFAAEGARVFVTDIDSESAERVALECDRSTTGSRAAVCDVTDSKAVAQAFRVFDREMGTLDILVNNAGIVHRDPDYVRRMNQTASAQAVELMSGEGIRTHWDVIENLSDEQFDRMLRTHLYGTFYCTREGLGRMRAGGRGGRIINMGSIMGSASLTGAPDYCAAKGAILAFTRATAREAASYGVLANAIAPGFVDTPLLSDMEPEIRALLTMQTPQARFGQPEEIASVALFLAGPGSSFMTGQVVSPNGGIYMAQ